MVFHKYFSLGSSKDAAIPKKDSGPAGFPTGSNLGWAVLYITASPMTGILLRFIKNCGS